MLKLTLRHFTLACRRRPAISNASTCIEDCPQRPIRFVAHLTLHLALDLGDRNVFGTEQVGFGQCLSVPEGGRPPTLSGPAGIAHDPVLRQQRKRQNGTLFLLKLHLLQANNGSSPLLATASKCHLSCDPINVLASYTAS